MRGVRWGRELGPGGQCQVNARYVKGSQPYRATSSLRLHRLGGPSGAGEGSLPAAPSHALGRGLDRSFCVLLCALTTTLFSTTKRTQRDYGHGSVHVLLVQCPRRRWSVFRTLSQLEVRNGIDLLRREPSI